MITKQLVHALYDQMKSDLSITSEQLELIVRLYQSFETVDEANLRKQEFQKFVDSIAKD